ncbi:hypothetical protein HMPREF1979_00178 [Actinomyces johnsonii F0542]|uniref:Uncharacterized protein n=1 Tax=Actinomyces johnsonii F0542 TaxID=1321818 RepID=U1S1F5_9ACTO|nr:hypothetical protein HMPREF1979_00178 [Actinomyces johnsonii F0542]
MGRIPLTASVTGAGDGERLEDAGPGLPCLGQHLACAPTHDHVTGAIKVGQ